MSIPPTIQLPSARAILLMLGCALILTSTPSVSAQGRNSDLARLWRDPAFKKQLLRSYGSITDVEPPATAEEMADYETITNLIPEDPREAERLLKLVISTNEEASALFDFTLGNLYFQEGNSRQAAEAYIAAIRKFENFRRAHQNLAIIYINSDNYQKYAINHFTRAIELGAADSNLFGLLGTAYMLTEQPVAAETAFRNAMLMAPQVGDWKLGLARALFTQKNYSEVISLTESMIKEKPDDISLWQLQTSAYIGAKDLPNAAANYEILDQLGQIDSKELGTLGDIYMNSAMFDLAADAYLRAYRKGGPSSDLEIPLRAAELLAARDAGSQASGLLEEVRKQGGDNLTDKQDLRILRLQAKIEMGAGNHDEAAAMLEQVVDRDPLDGESLITLGQHYANKTPEKAQFYYERAANLDEFTADANVRLAQLFVGQGDYRRAIPLLQRAQELKPRDSVGDYLEDLERYMKTRR